MKNKSKEFNNSIQWIYLELKGVAESNKWHEEILDEEWSDSSFQFLSSYIKSKLEKTEYEKIIASALINFIQIPEISLRDGCIIAMGFLEENFNL